MPRQSPERVRTVAFSIPFVTLISTTAKGLCLRETEVQRLHTTLAFKRGLNCNENAGMVVLPLGYIRGTPKLFPLVKRSMDQGVSHLTIWHT
jgi:hypothetical protein